MLLVVEGVVLLVAAIEKELCGTVGKVRGKQLDGESQAIISDLSCNERYVNGEVKGERAKRWTLLVLRSKRFSKTVFDVRLRLRMTLIGSIAGLSSELDLRATASSICLRLSCMIGKARASSESARLHVSIGDSRPSERDACAFGSVSASTPAGYLGNGLLKPYRRNVEKQ